MSAGGAVIDRERVLGRVMRSRVCAVVAPAGFGKSTLASMFGSRLGTLAVLVDVERDSGPDAVIGALSSALGAAGASDLAEAIGSAAADAALDDLLSALGARPERILLAFDDVHRLTPDGARWLATLLHRLPAVHHVVLLGRALPAALADAVADVVGADALRFDATEVAEYVTSAAGVAPFCPRALYELTEGWPAAVALAALRWDGRPVRRPRRAAGAQLLRELVADLVSALSPDQCEQVMSLSRLPLLTRELAELVAGDGAFDALTGSGLPLNTRVDEWIELPASIRDALDAPPLRAPQVAAATSFYADLCELGLATTMLVDDAARDAFAATLAVRDWTELDDFGLAQLRATFAVLGDACLGRHPQLALKGAWVAESKDTALRRRWLDLAEAGATAPHLRARVLAEQAREAARHGELDDAARLADRSFAATADRHDPIARGRAMLALGQVSAIRATPTALAEGRAQLEEAVLLFRLVRERRWEADALRALGYSVNFHGGRSEEAAEQLARSLAITGAANRSRAISLTYYADVLDNLGRIGEAEAAANEAIAIGRRLGDPMVVWFGAWSMMQIAAHRQDLPATRRWIDEAERHLGQWADDPRGFEFRLFVIDVCCAVGDEQGAADAFAAASEGARRLGLEHALSVAAAQYEATFGDPAVADRLLAALEGEPFAVDRSRWSRRMLRALAADRRGDDASAHRFLEEALTEAAAIGAGDLPERHEGRMMRILARHLPRATATAPPGIRVRLLGAFCVEAGGEDITPQPGHPATLVKILATRGAMVADEVLDQLWPDADPRTGRARLRNLLNRLRGRSGELVVRQGDTLQMRGDVDLDVRSFEALATRAFGAAAHERAGAARLAVAAYGGDLLPGDRYEDWAAAPRERLRRLYIGLADLLADDAIVRGDIDEAVRQLSAATDADPLDESRLVRAADLLLTKGTRVGGRRMVERAVGATLDLGLPVTGRLEELHALLIA